MPALKCSESFIQLETEEKFPGILRMFHLLPHGISSGQGLLADFPSDFMWNVVQSDFSSKDFRFPISQNGGTRSLW